jgi:hypothetical protein
MRISCCEVVFIWFASWSNGSIIRCSDLKRRTEEQTSNFGILERFHCNNRKELLLLWLEGPFTTFWSFQSLNLSDRNFFVAK